MTSDAPEVPSRRPADDHRDVADFDAAAYDYTRRRSARLHKIEALTLPRLRFRLCQGGQNEGPKDFYGELRSRHEDRGLSSFPGRKILAKQPAILGCRSPPTLPSRSKGNRCGSDPSIRCGGQGWSQCPRFGLVYGS